MKRPTIFYGHPCLRSALEPSPPIFFADYRSESNSHLFCSSFPIGVQSPRAQYSIIHSITNNNKLKHKFLVGICSMNDDIRNTVSEPILQNHKITNNRGPCLPPSSNAKAQRSPKFQKYSTPVVAGRGVQRSALKLLLLR